MAANIVRVLLRLLILKKPLLIGVFQKLCNGKYGAEMKAAVQSVAARSASSITILFRFQKEAVTLLETCSCCVNNATDRSAIR